MNTIPEEIAGYFSEYQIHKVAHYGDGRINDTYLVENTKTSFILQRLNPQIFKDPQPIMANIGQLSQGVDQALATNQILNFEVPKLLPSLTGQLLVTDQHGHYWRALSYIKDTIQISDPNNEQAYTTGLLLGRFHRFCSQLTMANFQTIIVDFHNTPNYLRLYQRTNKQNHLTNDDFRYCQQAIDIFAGKSAILEDAKAKQIPIRLTHGDPKLGNILFDKTSYKAKSLIDLDTFGPGLIHYDLADLIRSSANCPEAKAHDDSFKIDLEKLNNIVEGYSGGVADLLTTNEKTLLVQAIQIIPFELGLRFLTDHLQGDIYFKTIDRGQNLLRAKAQFRLGLAIRDRFQEIEEIISDHFEI